MADTTTPKLEIALGVIPVLVSIRANPCAHAVERDLIGRRFGMLSIRSF